MISMNAVSPLASLSRNATFSAGRCLRREDWDAEGNRSVYGADVGPHGHEWTLEVAYSGPISAVDGMITNLADLKPVLARAVAPLHNCWLEREIAAFQRVPPTLEHLGHWLWQRLPPRLGEARLHRLRLRESARARLEILPAKDAPKNASGQSESALPALEAGSVPEFVPQRIESLDRVAGVSMMPMKIARSYEFAAAHRLFVPALSQAENLARFDKCSNPAGHGHNYGLEVWVEGTPDPQSGLIIPTMELDALVETEVYARFDHKHLNEDCPEFAGGLVATSENLARLIFELLGECLAARGYRLARIGLRETQKNYFEVEA